MKKNINRLREWYHINFGKIVSFFFLVVIITLLLTYIPFINIVLSPALSMAIIVTYWNILFTPPVKTLVIISLILLLLAFGLTVLGLDSFVDPLGSIFYFLLFFICLNYAKEVFYMYIKKE